MVREPNLKFNILAGIRNRAGITKTLNPHNIIPGLVYTAVACVIEFGFPSPSIGIIRGIPAQVDGSSLGCAAKLLELYAHGTWEIAEDLLGLVVITEINDVNDGRGLGRCAEDLWAKLRDQAIVAVGRISSVH